MQAKNLDVYSWFSRTSMARAFCMEYGTFSSTTASIISALTRTDSAITQARRVGFKKSPGTGRVLAGIREQVSN